MFYYENYRLHRYYAKYHNQLFKTPNEYNAYLQSNNIQTVKTSVFRHKRNCKSRAEYAEGKWIEYDIAPGTVMFDERDLSIYTFETEDAALEFLKVYNFDRDVYSICPFEGYEEEPEKLNELDVEICPFDVQKENKTFAHFILSYMPNDSVKRAKRYAAHLKQIENIKKITPNTKIYIVAQNYSESEYIIDPQIEYKKFSQGIGASKARNECLKWLYESDYEYGIISDDDALLVVTETARQFFSEIESKPDKFFNAGIDVCYPRNMASKPWNMSDVEKAEWRGINWDFVWAPSDWFHWTLIRNLKKAYGKELYQREDINPAKGQGYDDMDFSYMLIDNGIRCFFECTIQLVSQLIEEENSVVQSIEDANYRAKSINATRAKFLSRTSRGGWDLDVLRARNNHPVFVTVPKELETDVWGEISGGRSEEMKEDFIQAKSDIDPV